MDGTKPSAGDEAAAIAISNVVTALTIGLMGSGNKAGATSFLAGLEAANLDSLADGPFRARLQQTIDAGRSIMTMLPG